VTLIGIGIDLVDVNRVRRLADAPGSSFQSRWFTAAEYAYCESKAFPAQHLAARLAAKEAVVKALRLPWDGPIPYRCVEIATRVDGAPMVRLSGRVQRAAQASGLDRVEVSLSHSAGYATAMAIAYPAGLGQEAEDPPVPRAKVRT
jgi:holo-[acyl-carrier protein] synthase